MLKVKYPVVISGPVQHYGQIRNRNQISGTSLIEIGYSPIRLARETILLESTPRTLAAMPCNVTNNEPR